MSVSSFSSINRGRLASGVFQQPSKVFVGDEMLDGDFIIKGVVYHTNTITIQNPEIVVNKADGDKTIVIRSMVMHDDALSQYSLGQKKDIVFRMDVLNQNNSYNIDGRQTISIGYGVYNMMEDCWTFDSQFFQIDCRKPVKILISQITNATITGASPIEEIQPYIIQPGVSQRLIYDMQTFYQYGI